VPLDGGFAFERTVLAKTPTPIPTGHSSSTAHVTSSNSSPHLRPTLAIASAHNPSISDFASPTPCSGASNDSPPLQPTSSLKKRPLDNQTPPAHVAKQQKRLNAWFRPGTVDDVVAYRRRTHLEWSEKVEDIRHQEERKREEDQIRKRVNATERKRKQRAKKVLDDMQVGRRDSAGLIIKTKPPKVYFHRFAKMFVFTQFTASAPYLRAFVFNPTHRCRSRGSNTTEVWCTRQQREN